MWDDRFGWSGEIPTSFPGLNPVALQRITPGSGLNYPDSITPSRNWLRVVGGANDGYVQGQWGYQMGLNTVNPATDKGGFKLPNFSGLWPSAGKLLVGLWTRQNYVMTHSPLMSTRGGNPLVYLATYASGRLRHQVYNASGAAILDQAEDTPWVQTLDWQFVGQLLDMDAKTSQLFSVNQTTKATWLGPVRSFTGTPNPSSTADLDIYALPSGTMWTTGVFDEAVVAHPSANFDLAAFADAMSLGLWADGQLNANRTNFTLTEIGITANGDRELSTGAERVSWATLPVVDGAPAGSTPYWSSDNGASWQTGAQLPTAFTGLLRWTVPVGNGQTFSGFTVEEPMEPAPTLASIPNQTLEQGGIANIPLVFSNQGAPTWTIVAPKITVATIAGSTLTLAAGFEVGTGEASITLTDEIGRQVTQTFTATVNARQWEDTPPPKYPHAPVILWNDETPEAGIIDALSAVVTNEVNGEQKFEMQIPANHKHAGVLEAERRITVADETYWIRRITKARAGRRILLDVYAEARFYELATKGQINAREFQQVTAGDVMTIALAGTGWTVGVANVTSLRTWSTEDTNPLELLRAVQTNHGGDLLFDNTNRRVSLVASSGRDQGIGFFQGRGLTDSKSVVDTTSLVTRIYAKNEDGLTIAAINGGKPYVEDFSFTTEVKEAVYDFKSGTSPYTMLAMAQATLAKRSRPERSYEVTVSDFSVQTDSDLDRFDAGDYVTVVDEEVGISSRQRIVKLEYDVIRPWNSKITLSAKLRELGSSETTDSGVLDTGSGVGTFDLVPFNLLLNSRFDNDLAHWAHFGAQVVPGHGTGDKAVRFSGSGERWIEQTVAPDNRDAYAFSMNLVSQGPAGWSPNVSVQAVVTYEDGSSETIDLELS